MPSLSADLIPMEEAPKEDSTELTPVVPMARPTTAKSAAGLPPQAIGPTPARSRPAVRSTRRPR
jgi:hypothetical protein